MSLTSSATISPPWAVLALVAHHLDPRTLAIASCVCKSWTISMSSDLLWKPLCNNHFPSLSDIHFTDFTVPYHRLYAIGHTAARRRLQTPRKPLLSLDSLIFAINIRTRTSHIVSLEKPGEELQVVPGGVFKFDIDVNYESPASMFDDLGDVKITWNVILRGWRGIFTMMDCEGKVSFSPGAEGWFSEELPSPGCCSSEVASGMVADVKLGFCGRRSESGGGRKVRAEKVSVGILSIVNWRYVNMDDGLRYLQHFLVPSDV
ncbi:probable F-box protein At5g04010 [Juglans microcarpa x Juglans regia]|uniref:probable F-box protein At5g04010 n=1 Tax=Juglans microcarpa x Juglans regia TaxID=2249226 RepID=UPI001B7F4652|nr:probable F-box protein At5g04010 [Juglans microcarpa x Juglans regia]